MLHYNANQRFTVQQCMEDRWFTKQELVQGMGRIITIDCINNLRSFCSEQKLQSAVANNLANKETNLAMNRELEHIFWQYDVNGDGMLSYDELIMVYNQIKVVYSFSIYYNQKNYNKIGYTQMLGCKKRAESQVHEILFKLGQKQLTEIDYHDFLKANVNLEHEVTDIKLKAAFNLFEIDGNGCITLDEIQYLLGGQEDVEEQVWIDLVFAADQNNDGEITFDQIHTPSIYDSIQKLVQIYNRGVQKDDVCDVSQQGKAKILLINNISNLKQIERIQIKNYGKNVFSQFSQLQMYINKEQFFIVIQQLRLFLSKYNIQILKTVKTIFLMHESIH